MAGLLDNLSWASRSLQAARLGLDVAGQNLANVNTAGYTRRALVLAEELPVDATSAGRGVTVVAIQAQRDMLVESRLWTGYKQSGFDATVVDGLTELEAVVGVAGASIDQRLTAFFDAFKTLADDPTSPTARDGVLRQGDELAVAFNRIADQLVQARRNADLALRSAVTEVNQLAAEVAALNNQIVAAGGSAVESLRDQQNIAIARLSELAAVTVTRRSDGGVDLSIGSGRPLVVVENAYPVEAEPMPPLGLTTLSTGGFDLDAEITGGRIGGLLYLRDTLAPAYQAQVDTLAHGLVTEVNALHATGFDANGDAGGAFFTPLGTATGAAAAMAIDPALAADGALVAASTTGAIGDNGAAQAIASLRDARVLAGGTATAIESWEQFAYRVGTDLASARSSNATQEQIMRQLEQLRAQVSGVSMDEEAANLIRFQRAYEANARYFTTIVDTLDTLLNMVR